MVWAGRDLGLNLCHPLPWKEQLPIRHYQHCSCQNYLAKQELIPVPNSQAHSKLSWDMIPSFSTFPKGEEWQQFGNSWKLPCQNEVPHILWDTRAWGCFPTVRNAHSLLQINSFSSVLNPRQHCSFALFHLLEVTLSISRIPGMDRGWTQKLLCLETSKLNSAGPRGMWGTEKLLGFKSFKLISAFSIPSPISTSGGPSETSTSECSLEAS